VQSLSTTLSFASHRVPRTLIGPRRRGGVAAVLVAIVLAGCGGGDDGSPAESLHIGTPASPALAPSELGTLKESGFGQAGPYVWVTSVVHNNSDYVGQTVTVSFNLLDAGGEILATESQVESFDRPKADHIVGIQVDVGEHAKVAKVVATLDVEAAGTFSDKPFPKVPISNARISKDGYGGRKFTFLAANPLKQVIKSPRVQVLCRDTSDAIVGGGNTYPDLLPAGGRIKVEVGVMTAGAPTTCTANVAAPSDWEGVADGGATRPGSSSESGAGSAEAGFRIWIDQFTAKDWDAQYATLLSAQQELISKREYKNCRAEATPSIKWGKVLSVQDVGSYSVPGTSLKLPATKVTSQVTSSGVKVPVDAHMFLEDGRWKWTMTSENLKNCRS
jgi:hypothetical protein